MPVSSPASVRKQIARRTPDPIYLLVGDDETEMSRLAAEMMALVEEDLRPFNTERLYAGEKGVTPAAVVESARILPMMADRRVVIVSRAEKMLKPKRRPKGASAGAEADAEDGDPPGDLDLLEAYVKDPVPQTTLVIVAADVDRTRKLYKAMQKHAVIVECWGLTGGRDARTDLRDVARVAEQLVRQEVSRAGQQIDAAAVRLVAERAGTDIVRLRGDVERLLLFTCGRTKITLEDARQVVSPETAQDDWAVINAIQQKDTPAALRQLALAIDAGGVPYVILGQLAWFVRERMPTTDPRRVPSAIDALFRTDLELKSSGGDARVLLERLIVDLCRG